MNEEEMNFSNNPDMDFRLWNYLDGLSSEEDKSAVEAMIKTSAAWKARYQELVELQQMLQSSELEIPSMRFTKNVMEEIARLHITPNAGKYINKKIIWGIAGFFLALIIGFLGYVIGQVDWGVQGESGFPVDFAKVDYRKLFSYNWINAFLMVNVILGLFLLDRYLANRKKTRVDQR